MFVIHVHLSPPSETQFCQHVMGYSVMAEKSPVFYKWQSASLSLSLDENLHTTFHCKIDGFHCEGWGFVRGGTV
jgi:hypothetical protein